MRIVNRDEFLAMPTGTLFSKYEPVVFDALMIKEETITSPPYSPDGKAIDFNFTEIGGAVDSDSTGDFVDKLNDSRENGTSVPMDFNAIGRDGEFVEDQLFAVWERKDVEDLIVRLLGTLRNNDGTA